MIGPELVEADARGVTTEVTMPLSHLCPFVDEADHGHATLSWRVSEWTVELHSLRAWLDTFTDLRVSHEALTALLRDSLAWLDLAEVAVTTRWETAGGQVTVRA